MQEKSKSISTSAMKGYLAEGKLMLRAIVPQGLFLWSPFSSQPNLSPAIKPTLGVQSIPTSPSPYFSRPLKAPCTQKMHTDVIHPMTQVTASCTHGHPFSFCLSSTLDSNCWGSASCSGTGNCTVGAKPRAKEARGAETEKLLKSLLELVRSINLG